jgi:hypothetical protein
MRYWWRTKQREPPVQMKVIVPERHEPQTYRAYHLEVKSMSVGWQVIITKDGSYVSNGSIKASLQIAIDEAHAAIDARLDAVAPAP